MQGWRSRVRLSVLIAPYTMALASCQPAVVEATPASPSISAPPVTERVALIDESSRSALAELDYATTPAARLRRLPLGFTFPRDARESSVFGIDVSHYEPDVQWEKVPDQRVGFAYVKATQGRSWYDSTFSHNWRELERLRIEHKPIFRGAYHFMSADDDPTLQANNFLATLKAASSSGSVASAADDLPPSLDLEWDFVTRNGKIVLGPNGKPIDRWAAYTPAQILAKIRAWLAIVEPQTGRQPIIYMNRSWWAERIGGFILGPYRIWVANYSAKVLGNERPPLPPGFTMALWQFSDRGLFDPRHRASKHPVDVSVFQGRLTEFLRTFNLPAP